MTSSGSAADGRGLGSAEAATRLAQDGPNTIPSVRGPSHARGLAAKMTHFFALMLWGAALLALAGGMPALAAAIAVVVLLNGVVAFAQELRAEHAAQRLRSLLPRRATVIRDGARVVVDAAELSTSSRGGSVWTSLRICARFLPSSASRSTRTAGA